MSRPPSIQRSSFRRGLASIAVAAFLTQAHTLATAQVVDRAATTPVTSVTSDQLEALPISRDLKTILDYHNQIRAEVNAPPLRWNPDLAVGAAAYGPIISRGGTLRHSSREGRKTIRENLLQSPRGIYSPLEMVQVWGAEQQYFSPGIFPDVSTDGDWASVGHYTQMIWPTTTDVGCAIHTDQSYDWLICRYSPPGNRDGDAIGTPPAIAQAPQPVNAFPATIGDAEVCDSWVLGAIIQPRFLPRLAITVDYFDVEISDTISQTGNSQLNSILQGDSVQPPTSTLEGSQIVPQFDLGVYGGWDWTSSWFEDGETDFGIGAQPVFGAQTTFWATPGFGIRFNGTYLPSDFCPSPPE